MVKVSVVIPIYNVSNYLEECLDSVISQTLKDIEIICVDDGSTDNSLEICKQYATKDPRIKIITKPNAGYGDSMNRGFDMATGEYVGIVESDDYVEPNMFKILYSAAIHNRCDVVKSDYFDFTSKNKKKQNYNQVPTDSRYYGKIINCHEVSDIFHFKMNTWTGIYLNEFIRNHKIRHNTTPGAAYQDNGFWFQTLSLAERVLFIKKAFYHYRQDNPNSSINSKGKVYCMCEEFDYIEKQLTLNPELHRELYGIMMVKRYFNYQYTYKRISEQYKIEFLQRFANDFRKPFNEGVFNEKLVDKSIIQMIERIVTSPETFYYEDTIWTLQHDAIDMLIRRRD